MTRFARVWALLLVLAGFGCAGAGGAPGWVNGARPPAYPESKYVAAIGIGENLSAAQVAAKGELSRVFSAKLASEIELIDRESVVDGVSTENSDLVDQTRIRSDLELQGVEVPLHWRDSRTGQIWAFAVLERNKECLRIRSEGRDLVAELDRHVGLARRDPNPLFAVRSSVHAVRVRALLDGLQARSRVLGIQCAPPRADSTGQLKGEAAERLAALSFVVRTADVDPRSGRAMDELPQLREQIAGNLSKLGFQVGPATGARVIPVDARLRLLRVERGTDWVEFRYEGSAEVGSPFRDEPALIVVETAGAESHPEPSSARLRARRAGERDLARQLEKRIKAFLEENAFE